MDRSERGPAAAAVASAPRAESAAAGSAGVQAEGAPRADRFALALVGIALVLGLVRFLRLSEWSLWIDESLTWADVHHGIEGGEIRNPLGYWLIQWTVDCFGGTPTEWSLRILPAVAGWLCIPATFLAFRGLFGARRAGVASLLIAVSSWHLYWSQNARFYTFAQLAMLAGAWILFAALARGRAMWAIVGLAVAAGGALFHPSAVLALPALGLAPFLLDLAGRPVSAHPGSRRAARVLAVVSVAAGLVGLRWAWTAWQTYAYQKGAAATLAAAASSIAHFAKTTGFFVTPLLGAAVLCGAWMAWRSRRGPDAFVVVVVVTVLVLALVASTLARVSAQYVFVVLPWIALAAALPIGNGVPGPFGRRGEVAWILVLALPALATCGLYMTVRRGERPPWREAYQYVANAREPDEQIYGMEASVGEFYLAPGNTDLRRPTALTWLDYFNARVPEHWARKGRRAWYVVNPEQFAGWDPRDSEQFQRYLREECRLEVVWPLYVESRDLSVWVYRRD